MQLRALSEALPADLIPTECQWTPEVETLALDALGKPYSYVDAALVGVGLTPTAKGEICSLYAGQLLNTMGLNLPRRGLTPEALVSDLLDQGHTLVNLNTNEHDDQPGGP